VDGEGRESSRVLEIQRELLECGKCNLEFS